MEFDTEKYKGTRTDNSPAVRYHKFFVLSHSVWQTRTWSSEWRVEGADCLWEGTNTTQILNHTLSRVAVS